MHDEMDSDIQLIFEEHNRRLSEEPFLRDTLHRLKIRQVRQDLLYKLLFVLGLVCCTLLSPFFIRASTLLSEFIGIGLGYFEGFLEMPIVSVVCAGLLMVLTGRKLAYAIMRP